MKARKVKGLDRRQPFGDAVQKILDVRLKELRAFAGPAQDPTEVEALHDMRIAVKRMRYVLEVAEPALGSKAGDGVKAAKALQDLLGEIHDCDELLPMVRAHVKKLRAEDVAAAAALGRRSDLAPRAVREAPNRKKYRGLESLATYVAARRQVLYAAFVEKWPKLESQLTAAAQPAEAVPA